MSKWILKNIEQLLEPDEIETVWRELLSFYSPPTASVENVSGPTQAGWIDADLEEAVLPQILVGKLIQPEDIAETILFS